MAIDKAALKTVLATDVRYDAAVRSGNNGECLRLLGEVKVGSVKVWDDIPVADFVAALGDFVLSDAAETRLRTLAENGGVVPTSRAGVRTWLQTNITDPVIKTALKDLAEREQTWSEVAGAGVPSLSDVRTAVSTIAKSHVLTYHAEMAPITEARTQRLVDAELDVATTPENMRAKSNV